MNVLKKTMTYQVTLDFGGSLVFYRDHLGLPLKFQDEGKWAEFVVPDGRFALSAVGEAPQRWAGGAVTVFDTDDLEEVAEHVARGGGEIVERREMGDHGTTLTIAEPGGTIFQIRYK